MLYSHLEKMSDADFNRAVDALCLEAAEAAYRRRNPGCDAATAKGWAVRNAHHFEDEVISVLAMMGAKEKEDERDSFPSRP